MKRQFPVYEQHIHQLHECEETEREKHVGNRLVEVETWKKFQHTGLFGYKYAALFRFEALEKTRIINNVVHGVGFESK